MRREAKFFTGCRPIDPKNAPQGVCVFAGPANEPLHWYRFDPCEQIIWWRFNWSDLLALADKLPFDQVRA